MKIDSKYKPSLNLISLVTNTSTPAHSAAKRSSDEKTPKCAVPLLIRRKQSNGSVPITHSIFVCCFNVGQNLSAFLYLPRASTKHKRTGQEVQIKSKDEKKKSINFKIKAQKPNCSLVSMNREFSSLLFLFSFFSFLCSRKINLNIEKVFYNIKQILIHVCANIHSKSSPHFILFLSSLLFKLSFSSCDGNNSQNENPQQNIERQKKENSKNVENSSH